MHEFAFSLLPDYDETTARLSLLDQQLADVAEWPAELWAEIVASKANCWTANEALGLAKPDRVLSLRRYGQIASGSLVSAFILTQHDAAVRRLAVARDRTEPLLDRIRLGQLFATVGISLS